jgi:hypothetical protein
MKQKAITPEIKPCPFCGSDARIISDDEHYSWFYKVECNKDYRHTLTKYCNLHRAIVLWNNRGDEIRKVKS